MPHLTEARALYDLPLNTRIFKAQQVHRAHQDPAGVQLCTLKSIKTGACPEDCAYCPQSIHNQTGLEPEALMQSQAILADSRKAQHSGPTRF